MKNDRIVLASSYAYNSQIIRLASLLNKVDRSDDRQRQPGSKSLINQKSSRASNSEKSPITHS